MNWRRVCIEIGRNDPSPVERALIDLGAVSIEYSDAADDPIMEPAPGATPLWPTITISALFDAAVGETEVRLAVACAIEAKNVPAMTFESIADQDWIKNWQRSLQPMQFGRDLWVCPTGSKCPTPDGTVVELDPGLAFGTGSHPTTALCLDWLASGDECGGTVLDFGCGSGILSIAALALGAERVLGIDLDEQALRATRENAARNRVSERLDIAAPGATRGRPKFDRIVANILSGTLIDLAAELRGFSHTGTRIALSGILTDQIDSVIAAYEPWVDFDPPIERDDWALLSGTVTVA